MPHRNNPGPRYRFRTTVPIDCIDAEVGDFVSVDLSAPPGERVMVIKAPGVEAEEEFFTRYHGRAVVGSDHALTHDGTPLQPRQRAREAAPHLKVVEGGLRSPWPRRRRQ